MWVLTKQDPYYSDGYEFEGLYEDKAFALDDLVERERETFGDVVLEIVCTPSNLDTWNRYGTIKAYYYLYRIEEVSIRRKPLEHS